MAVCVSVPHCMDPDITWNCKGCPVVVHNWVDLQSMHGFHGYDNIALNAKCQRVLALLHAWFSYNCSSEKSFKL